MNDAMAPPPGAALIAGAGDGVFPAVAEALAEAGFDVHLAGPDEEALNDIRAAIAANRPVAIEVHATDLGQPINAAVLAMQCDDAAVLVNALPWVPPGGLDGIDADAWQAAFRQSLMATVELCREILEGMEERGRGVIVTIAAAAGPDDILRHSLNAAVAAFCRSLSGKTLGSGVSVHFVTSADDSEATARAEAEAIRGIVLEALGLIV